MLYLAMLFMVVVLNLIVSIVGRRICTLVPFRLQSTYRFYFSPVVGLAAVVLIVTGYGWLSPFRTALSLPLAAVLLFLSVYFEKDKVSLLKYSFSIIGVSLVASCAVLAPILIFGSYNSFNDTFTYLVHGQWLQSHAFTEKAIATGHFPALSQVSLYQGAGSRMGASFFLAWAQSLFRVDWSYYVYPAAICVPITACAFAVGGTVKLLVRRARVFANLSVLSMATMHTGFIFGAIYGFFPQTFGLAFACGGAPLLAGMLAEEARLPQSYRRTFRSVFPAALVLSALVFAYNDLMAVVGAGFAAAMVFLLFMGKNKTRLLVPVLLFGTLVCAIINFEIVRVFRNFLAVLGVAAGATSIGWTVPWRPLGFLAHSFGFKSAVEGIWIFGHREVSLFAFALTAGCIAYFLFSKLIIQRRVSAYLVTNLSILGVFLVGFLFFRYLSPGLTPEETGKTFLQFKLAKWSSPFCIALASASFAFLSQKRGKFFRAVMVTIVMAAALSSVLAQPKIASIVTSHFMVETGNQRAGFNTFLHLRDLTRNIEPNEVIYMNLGDHHHKLKEMIAYVLPDVKLAADYRDDGYITGHLPPEDRVMSYSKADWILDFATSKELKAMSAPAAGNLVLKRRPPSLVKFLYTSDGYAQESDDSGWWHWTDNSLTFKFLIMGHQKKIKLVFTYVSATPDRKLKILLSGKASKEFNIQMSNDWTVFQTETFELGEEGEKLDVKFVSNEPPAPASEGDSRNRAFLIKNIEIIPVE